MIDPLNSRGAALSFDGRSAARFVFLACLSIELGLVLLDYYVNFSRFTDVGALRRLANITREDGLASWFGTTQTLLVALTAWGIWLGVRVAHTPSWRLGGWLLVAVLFSYMAVDDGVQLHERLGTAYEASDGPGSGLFPSFTWQLLFVPVLGAALAAACLFLWNELRDRWTAGLIAAAFVMFGMAVGLDFFEGLAPDHSWNPYTAIAARFSMADFTQAHFRQSPYDSLVHFSRSLEEFLEMLANTCIWTALLSHLNTVMPDIRFGGGTASGHGRPLR